MTVGKRIRQARESAGMSQVDLAKAMRVEKQTLYKYEMDIVTNIPSDKIELAAKVLGVTPVYLMGWDTSNRDLQLSPLERQLVLAYRQADTITQSNILKLLDVPTQEAESKIS